MDSGQWTVEQKLLSFCKQNALLLPGDRVCVAVSGGADSMALLTALLALRERLGITVCAAHFHHGLRGQEADRDAEFVSDWCRAHDVPCAVGRGDTQKRAAETGESLEEAARALRYAFFETLDADKIATAHTADDNAETVLLHLLRGTGLRGLAGIPARRGRFVRPLLALTREDVEIYLRSHGVPHVEDSSNAADDCVRNRLRHRVLPLLRAENPAFAQSVLREGRILRQEDDYLSALAAAAEEGCRDNGGWSCRALSALEPVLRHRVLLGMLRALPLENPSQVHLQALERLIASASPSASCTLPEGWTARRENDRLVLDRADFPVCPTAPLNIPGVTVLSEIGLQIRAFVTENSNFAKKNAFTFAFRYDMIAASAWSVRARQVGDSLRLPGGSRSLKRLLIDRKVPRAQRDALPVVLCGGRVAGVLGLAVSEDFLPPAGQPALLLTLEQISAEPIGGHKGESH